MAISFNPEIYRGKKQVYRKLPHHPGICWIWDWSDEKKKYIQRQVGLKYYAYKKLNKRQFSKSFEHLQEAKKWRSSTEVFLCSSISSEETFKQVMDGFIEQHSPKWKVTTKELYLSYMKHLGFFCSLPMKQINQFAIDEWLRAIKKPEYLSGQNSTRVSYQHELTLLKQVCTYYQEYRDENYVHPCKKRHNVDCIVNHEKFNQAKERSKEKYLSMSDCQRFLECLSKRAEQNSNDWIYFHLAEFQMLSGCRIGEACALAWSDVDLAEGNVRISKTVQWPRDKTRSALIGTSTKTGRARGVSLPIQLVQSLRRWQSRSGRSTGLVFSSNPFRPITYRCVQDKYNRALKALGLPWTSTHLMRHSYATLWLTLSGGSVQSLQKQLGHSSANQSLHYAKVTEDLIQKGLKEFEKGLGKVVSIGHENNENQTSELGQAGLAQGEFKA